MWSLYPYRLEAVGMGLHHGGVYCEVADTAELRRALGSREPRGRVGPRLILLLGYTHWLTAGIISLSSCREVARYDGNVDGMAVLHRRLR